MTAETEWDVNLPLLRTRSSTFRIALLLGLASVLLSTPGQASPRRRQAREKETTPRLATSPAPGRYLLVGVNLGLTGPPETGNSSTTTKEVWPAVGLEASAVKLPGSNFLWFGGYADLVQVLPNRATRLTFGPEAGFGPLALDAGLLGEYSGRSGRFNGGFQARGMLTLGVIAVYASMPCLYAAAARGFRAQMQFGLLLKVPIFMGD
jgi:hypothetical protein